MLVDPGSVGPPNETAIAHIRGTPQFGTPRFVAGVGGGGSARLVSLHLPSNNPVPVADQVTPQIIGRDIQLLAIKRSVSPTIDADLLLSGIVRNGDLWLTSWRVEDDGRLTELETRGFGSNADLRVETYAMAFIARPTPGRTIVVTPLRTSNNQLRMVSWAVSPDGSINGIEASADWGDPATNTRLSVSQAAGSGVVVTHENTSGRLYSSMWSVSSSGGVTQTGGAASGLGLRGNNPVSVSIDAATVLPLNDFGFVTALHRQGGASASGPAGVEMHVWEPRIAACDGGCWSIPYAISDNSFDDDPGTPGIQIANPVLTEPGDGIGVRGLLTDGLIENEFGVGSGRLFQRIPAGEPTSVHMASVAKNTTLLLAVEAIQAGTVSLSDDVTFSDAASSLVGPNSSNMGSEAGETQSLNTILHGLMMVSANDGAAAIAEHISGSTADFVDLMNQRTAQLGLSDTSFGQPPNGNGGPAGGGISTPQDQVTLWLFARNVPRFLDIAGEWTYSECGTDASGAQKCHFFDKGNGGYAGISGWKGGNGGFGIPGYNGPFCVGSGCLVVEALRVGRPILVSLFNSGNRWRDARRLLDYGFRRQYTPDNRANAGNQGGLAADFDIDAITDGSAITSQIENGVLKVCNWGISVDVGQIDKRGCLTPSVGLLTKGDAAAPTRVDGVRVSHLLFEGDYITGHLDDSDLLRLNLWRLGPIDQ